MGRESSQQKVGRVRPPRVHIQYEVHVGDATEKKELPFVVGVLGDFTGDRDDTMPRLKDRKFTEINPDNFDDVLKGMKPHLNFSVPNKINDKGGNIGVDLSFESIEDFEPENVARKIPPLEKLLTERQRLSDLRGSLQGNDKLREILESTAKSPDDLDKIKAALSAKTAAAGQSEEESNG
jgi:type VI secretion system protein ImpB